MEFTDYVHQQRPALMRFATVLTGQSWLADDLVCDVLGKAFERWDRIGSLSQPHAYVRRMIVNEHLSWRRRLQRRVTVADVDDNAVPVEDGTREHAERDAMLSLLDTLPRRQRTAIVLRFYAGLTDAEIASELGCRESTVRSQISRGLATLRIDTTTASSGHRATAPLESR